MTVEVKKVRVAYAAGYGRVTKSRFVVSDTELRKREASNVVVREEQEKQTKAG